MCIVIIDGDSHITSPITLYYNSFAWAVNDQERCWFPDRFDTEYWPAGIPRENTLSAFIDAYSTNGFEVCPTGDPNLEFSPNGFFVEKIAIYTIDGRPSHACRQLNSGRWTSKIGVREDVEHELVENFIVEIEGIINSLGNLNTIMRRIHD
ncbi:DUF7689 domain-containing protein [Microcystis aeruginosa]|jgi:hypothetical protein|uniref:DUF7689 domain-containing protein n=1 Tax=Microcystis aeruginosa TaxID=1126 RepID=UPI00046A0357|nr:hypothetical protein [Microcystis aeruginosa]MDB9398207.1 hypothetical protein [Microcystis aeruginosa CS-573]